MMVLLTLVEGYVFHKGSPEVEKNETSQGKVVLNVVYVFNEFFIL